MMTTEHILKVQPPYFEAILDGSKPFEVRRNDRAYQRGDTLLLWETQGLRDLRRDEPASYHRTVTKVVTYVYSGDPRFGGIEPGHVVLGLGDMDIEWKPALLP
jgi:hypothetical protein